MSKKTKEDKKIGIADLAPELLTHIFDFLAPKEICKLSKICKAFYSTSRIDSIWQKKCSELPIPPFLIQNDELTFRQIYTKVLHKYWKLLGFWRRNVTWYGGLLHVKFDTTNGTIVGTEWNPPKYLNVKGPLSRTPAFCVVPDLEQDSSGDSSVALCGLRQSDSQQHYCNIALGNYKDGKVVEFRTECLTPDVHDGTNENGMNDDGMGQLPGALRAVDHRLMMLRKSHRIRQYKHKYDYTRLVWPLPVLGAIIQPGLFKGDYSSHGVEFIMLTYVDERTVEGIKVTGDPNIPCGQVTFRANMLEAFVMNIEEQSSISELVAAVPLSPPIPPNQLPVQPFRIPDQVHTSQLDLPNVCKARFSGVGQIALDGYTNSSFVPGHWIIFNEDFFCFIWFSLRAGSLFHRVQEEF